MLRQFCKSKIQGLVVTDKNLNYVGSVTIDPLLAEAADILPWEMVQVLNMSNGARIETYYIPGAEPGRGDLCLNGAAARLFEKGDGVIILSTVYLSGEEAAGLKPRVIITDERNRLKQEM